LTIVRVVAHDSLHTNAVTVSLQAQGDLTSDYAEADGSNSAVVLNTTGGSLQAPQPSSGNVVNAASISLLAAGFVEVDGSLGGANNLIDIRAGSTFHFAGLPHLSFTADSIIIETGDTLDVDGTLRASNSVQLTSDNGNIVITGTITGQNSSGLQQ